MKSGQLQPTAYEETLDNIAPHDQQLKEVLRQRLCFVWASENSEMISSVSDFFNQVRSSQTVHIFIDAKDLPSIHEILELIVNISIDEKVDSFFILEHYTVFKV
ncbi:hypothetical protein HID58_034613 [Brassica napus]|uniref:BnaA09g27100D protein n=3 Tax=Brassica TaxID=3705 RepID=A0A078H9D3_BRANA|nr:hypothetical protein HID58_034613 [Brassica napus]CAF2044975.1 unnamed protein product [Brassica napus]CDY34084.1 BnaA09g27100D [Brassica napus]